MSLFFHLFWTFFHISVFTIGGGYNMIPLMQQAMDANGWLPAARFMDILAIAEATPGPIAVNTATFVGHQVAGLPGALAATCGACLPGALILFALGSLGARLRKHPLFQGVMAALLPVLAALLAGTTLQLSHTVWDSLRGSAATILPTALIFCAALYFLGARKKQPLPVFAVAAAIGIVFQLCGIWQTTAAKPAVDSRPALHRTTLRFRGFDPASAVDVPTATAVGKIYEGLLQYDYFARPYRLIPCLAEELPAVSEDGLTFRFRIRRGIYFMDDPCFTQTGGIGRELTADDFVYAIKRIADQKTGSGGYWAFRGKIEGLDAFRAASAADTPTDYDAPVSGLRALSPYELEIRLTEPYPQLLWVLAMPYAFAVPREAVEHYGRAFANHPVGTGPYRLASARQNYRYEYTLNPKWAETGRIERIPPDAPTPDAGQPLPLTPRIVEVVIGDASTAWLMFLSGQLDLMEIPRDNWESVMTPHGTLRPEMTARGLHLSTAPKLQVSYIAFNMDDPTLGPNKPLRQALHSAFDTPQWQTFQHNRILPGNGPIPPTVAGTREAPPRFPFDLEAAAALLAEAGYPGGRDPATGRRLQLTLTLGQADNPEARQSAELLANFFSRIGIALQLEYLNWPAFLEKLEKRQAQMFMLSWVGDYPDAQNFLQLFHSANTSPGSNRANYTNPAFDHLYQQIQQLPPDHPQRPALCRQATDILAEDCPWIITGYPIANTLAHDFLTNHHLHDFFWGLEKYQGIR